MSTDELAYGEQLPVLRRRGPAFGDAGPPPAVETEKQHAGALDRRTEAVLGLAILIPVIGVYTAIGYGIYLAVSALS